jgi:hypothetical protein
LSEKILLSATERGLLSSLFSRYSRLVIEQEFLSGYSGARTFLAMPIRPDNRSDAYTIVKIGEAGTINQEFSNFEMYVKDTLPPITARIQNPPVIISPPKQKRNNNFNQDLACLQYTFIGEPGTLPISLRQALLDNPKPEFLHVLFNTFGPGWWMQRIPYSFKAALEYDRLLPTHLVLEPTSGRGVELTGDAPSSYLGWKIGDTVTLHGFHVADKKISTGTFSLESKPRPGYPPYRIRWSSLEIPQIFTGRVVETRFSLLEKSVRNLDLYGSPDPIPHLANLLEETVKGTRSTIHGDLNLENILIGPGELVWLIDFAQTREAPPLIDFAHLEADFIAHVLAPRIRSIENFLELISGNPAASDHQLALVYQALNEIALRCLANPNQPREWQLVRLFALIGALKYANIDQHARHCLYLTAAQIPLKLS